MLRPCLESQGHVDKQRCPQASQVLGGGQEELDPPSEEDPPLLARSPFTLSVGGDPHPWDSIYETSSEGLLRQINGTLLKQVLRVLSSGHVPFFFFFFHKLADGKQETHGKFIQSASSPPPQCPYPLVSFSPALALQRRGYHFTWTQKPPHSLSGTRGGGIRE